MDSSTNDTSLPKASDDSAPSSGNAGPAMVSGQKRPAEVIDLEDEEAPKSKRRAKKKKKTGKSRKGSASAPESLEEGETVESATSSNPSRPDSAASDTAVVVPRAGWNSGVSSGLRVSFGSKADKTPAKPPSPSASNATATRSPVEDWQWPLHSLILFDKPPRKEDNTKSRFSRWYRALLDANTTREDVHDPTLVQKAWGIWLRRHPSMNERWSAAAERDVANLFKPDVFSAFARALPKVIPEPKSAPKADPKSAPKPAEQTTGLRIKGQAAAAQKETEEAALQRAKQEAAAQRAKEEAAAQRAKDEAAQSEQQGTSSPLEEGETVSSSPEAGRTSLSPEDIQHLQRYFPGVDPREPFCVSCAEYGHYQADCKPCSICSSWTHRDNQCSTLWRCERCDQLGHDRAGCRAKLAAAPGEKGKCNFCKVAHNERQCPLLSQSYVFDPSRARKIKAWTPSCFHCGGKGHYGDQCLSNPQRLPDDLPLAVETWSMQNLLQYLDPDAEGYGIEGAARPPANNGKAPPTHAPKGHVLFEEADDDEDDNEPFLRPSVKKQTQPGHITFGAGGPSTFSGPPGANGSSSSHPPLPLGPPPPLPPPASSLPPLPPGPPPQTRQQRRNAIFRPRGGGKRGGGRGGRGRGR